jgi:hypothetical protein
MEPQKYSMSFTQDELNTIITALSEMPFKVAQPLITKMIKDFAELTGNAAPAPEVVAE